MVSGVSRVQVFGEQKYAVRVQVDPDQLAVHNIGIDEVQKAIASANTNLPTGRLQGAPQAFTIESNGSLINAAALPARDCGLSQWRARAARAAGQCSGRRGERPPVAWIDDMRCMILAINKQPGTNTVEVVENIKKLLPEFRREIPAGGAILDGVRCFELHPRFHSTTWSSRSCSPCAWWSW